MYEHINSGLHKYVTIKNATDEAILYYAQQKHLQYSIDHPMDEESSLLYINEDSVTMSKFRTAYPQGWARKIRRVRKLTEKQTQFIEDLYHRGAMTKTKLFAEQMAEKMQEHMVGGAYYFSSYEFLEPGQIRSLISRINKRQTMRLQELNEDDGIDENIDAICSVIDNNDDDSNDNDFLAFDS